MEKEVDVKKVVGQHREMEDFFSGGCSIKTRKKMSAPVKAPHTPPVSAACKKDDAAAQLQEIADEVNRCCHCGLGKTRTHAVPGEGNVHAEIVFVGEGPGADEDEQGRPFVGRSGQLLDKIIIAMGLQRSDVFICNIVKCRPPENRDPRPEEIIKCLPYLQRQLDIIKPKIIVALGAHAAHTLLNNTDPIGQLRGKFLEYHTTSGFQIKLMCTYHPSYLLRNYSDDNRRRVWDDMKKVMADLGRPVQENSKSK